MARGYLVFGDIEGKLDVLIVECTRCQGSLLRPQADQKHGRLAHDEMEGGVSTATTQSAMRCRCTIAAPDRASAGRGTILVGCLPPPRRHRYRALVNRPDEASGWTCRT
jgi:hypothetical protein